MVKGKGRVAMAESVLLFVFMKFVSEGKEIDADMIVKEVGDRIPPKILARKLGAMFRRLKAAKVIEPCGFRLSERNGSAAMQVWRPTQPKV